MRMHALTTIILFLTILPIVSSATTIDTVEAPIASVTVYPNRALVTRSVTLNLDVGEHSIVLEGLLARMNALTLRASCEGPEGAIVSGLSHRLVDHVELPRKDAADLQKQIYRLARVTRGRVTDKMSVYNQQKELLGALVEVSKQEMIEEVQFGKIDVAEWEAAYDFVGQRLHRLNDSIRDGQIRIDSIDNVHKKLLSDLSDAKKSVKSSSRTVEIDIRMPHAGEIVLSIQYVTSGASWHPLYDARLSRSGQQVELTYYAEVVQSTGEDWNDVQLTLSTARPSRGTGAGRFNRWSLSVYAARPVNPGHRTDSDAAIVVRSEGDIIDRFKVSNDGRLGREAIEGIPMTTVDDLLSQVQGVVTNAAGEVFVRGGRSGEINYIVNGAPLGDPLTNVPYELAARSAFKFPISASFATTRRETIASGGDAVRTTLGSYTLDAEIELICRPRNRDGVYRQATVHNNTDTPLLPGPVSIFADANFLGQGRLDDFVSDGQTFELSFGPDDRVEVKRKIVSYRRSNSSDRIKIDQTVEISITSHRDRLQVVRVEESIPYSRDDRIKVKINKVEPKTEIKGTEGKIVWDLSLEPGVTATLKIPIRIEYPRSVAIIGL